MGSAPTSWLSAAAGLQRRGIPAPDQGRGNLAVLTGAHADMSFEAGARPVVQWIANGKRESARAAREVIVAAGAFQTPQLLQLSARACGPLREHASGCGGCARGSENLQDHYQGARSCD